MIEPADGGVPLRRAFLRIGGKTLAHHQLEAAIAANCERIVCIATSLEPEVIALQHAAENAGKQFNTVAGPRDLARVITAQDELIVFSDGLLPAPAEAAKLVAAGPAVLVQPIESGLEAGFERIDLNRASGGLMRIPARIAEPVYDFPQDCDIPSTLTRLALQQGIEMREIPPQVRAGGNWPIIASESQAYAAETGWLSAQLNLVRKDTPVSWLVHAGVSVFGSSLLHHGNASKALTFAAIAATFLGLAWAWLGAIAAGLIFCALGWIALECAVLMHRLEQAPTVRAGAVTRSAAVTGWLIDLAIVAICAIGCREDGLLSVTALLFPALILVMLVRLLPRLNAGPIADWMSDRLILLLVLSLASALGILADVIRLFAVLLLAAALILSAGKRITPP